jgi:elongation factor P
MLTTADFKKGLRVLIDGEPYAIMEHAVQTPSARGSATLVKTKVRNILSGAVFDKTFKSGEKFEQADVQIRNVQLLYSSAEECTFMDTESYDQFSLSKESIGEGIGYLADGCALRSVVFNDRVVGVELPQFIEIEVASVEPSAKTDTQSGSATKAATLVTGATIRVPLYLKAGEIVEVETATGRFVRRVR